MSSRRYYDRYKRDKEATAFYNSSAWRKCREVVLIRDDFLCVLCLKKGIIQTAATVHHMKHFKEYPELALDIDNLISVCLACHNKLHPERGMNKKSTKKRKGVRVVEISANNERID
ncbi:HNH endonuclease signature motif containing protein [Alkalihalophilus lindianensis]|uniref:Putative HNH nuclease YajD n=1 Tax=Alkalihalophilus lindianensis TaxID=1630542 RepID=A0ABU3X7E0_9BACI|nr:HNH endonuclease signature motif containing protein [Alkalihalophilus lindianensis]MDV2683812.1 HNH endonuclease signature motif containing protein [Alkalihalophilus lindianensis]MDV2683878.1 HNH endonuclease signature motif containing protein [Alkalihalophilus lindianensis]